MQVVHSTAAQQEEDQMFSKFKMFASIAFMGASLAACGGSDSTNTTITNPVTTGTPVLTTSVLMQGTAFTPPAIQVSPGAIVTFTNQDGILHNATFANSA